MALSKSYYFPTEKNNEKRANLVSALPQSKKQRNELTKIHKAVLRNTKLTKSFDKLNNSAIDKGFSTSVSLIYDNNSNLASNNNRVSSQSSN